MRLLGVGLCVAILAGCATPRLPEDVQETFRNGERAEKNGKLNEAVIHYSRVLEAHPDLSDALLARGECYYRLSQEGTAELRRKSLERALTDFGAAAEKSEEPGSRVLAGMRQITCLVELEQHPEAQIVLDRILADPDLVGDSRAHAHRILGELQLRELHQEIAVDHTLSADDLEQLGRVRQARRHFGESLEIKPDSPRSLLGKGICLLHEGLLEESEEYLGAARGAEDLEEDSTSKAGLLYLLALVRERRLGPNLESNAGYLASLAHDEAHHCDLVYVRLYRLLADSPDLLGEAEREETIARLLRYEGQSPAVWEAADRYFSQELDRDDPLPSRLLGHATARARRGEPESARTSFAEWIGTGPAEPESAIHLVFRAGPGVADPSVRDRLSLERCRAYWLVYRDDIQTREPAREELRELIARLDQTQDPSPTSRVVHGQACALLAEELLDLARAAEVGSPDRERFLKEAERLTITERRLRGDPDGSADFRLARIDHLGSADPDVDLALRAAQKDPHRDYLPAFLQLAQAYPELLANEQGLEPHDVEDLLARIRIALVSYQGEDSTVRTMARNIEEEQQEAERAREAKRLADEKRIEEERQEAVRLARFRPEPCGDCGRRVLKTDKVCRCGSPLD